MRLLQRRSKGHRPLSPDVVSSFDSNSSSQTSVHDTLAKETEPAFWNNNDEAASLAPSHFSSTFSLEFTEDSFAPMADSPGREPVWKKRLRSKGMLPVTTGHEQKDEKVDSLELKELDTTPEPSVLSDGENRDPEPKEKGKSESPCDHCKKKPNKVPLKTEEAMSPRGVAKSVSFDELNIQEEEKTHKTKQNHRAKEETGTGEDEGSFGELIRTKSSLSGVFSEVFGDEDFSLATPTIYTNTSDDRSSISSYPSARKSRHRDSRRRRKSRSRYDDDSILDDEYLEIGVFSCPISNELKLLTDLLSQGHDYLCVEQPEQRRIRSAEKSSRRKSAATSRRKSRPVAKEEKDNRRLV